MQKPRTSLTREVEHLTVRGRLVISMGGETIVPDDRLFHAHGNFADGFAGQIGFDQPLNARVAEGGQNVFELHARLSSESS